MLHLEVEAYQGPLWIVASGQALTVPDSLLLGGTHLSRRHKGPLCAEARSLESQAGSLISPFAGKLCRSNARDPRESLTARARP